MNQEHKHHWIEITVTIVICVLFIFLTVGNILFIMNNSVISGKNIELETKLEDAIRDKTIWEAEKHQTFQDIGTITSLMSEMLDKQYKNLNDIIVDLRVKNIADDLMHKKHQNGHD